MNSVARIMMKRLPSLKANVCLSPNIYGATNVCRTYASDSKLDTFAQIISDNPWIDPAASAATKYTWKRMFKNYRPISELQFQPSRGKDSLRLSLNVCGCSAKEVQVTVKGSNVRAKAEGKALMEDPWINKAEYELPNDLKYEAGKIQGFVQKGRLMLYIPAAPPAQHIDMNNEETTIECMDLAVTTDQEKTDDSDTRKGDEFMTDELDFSTMAGIKFLSYVAEGAVKMVLQVPPQLDFITEFNRRGLNVYLNVSGCCADELKVSFTYSRRLSVTGEGNCLGGPRAKINMDYAVPENFKFNPGEVKGYVCKGELYVLFSYSRDRCHLELAKTYKVPLTDVLSPGEQ